MASRCCCWLVNTLQQPFIIIIVCLRCAGTFARAGRFFFLLKPTGNLSPGKWCRASSTDIDRSQRLKLCFCCHCWKVRLCAECCGCERERRGSLRLVKPSNERVDRGSSTQVSRCEDAVYCGRALATLAVYSSDIQNFCILVTRDEVREQALARMCL